MRRIGNTQVTNVNITNSPASGCESGNGSNEYPKHVNMVLYKPPGTPPINRVEPQQVEIIPGIAIKLKSAGTTFPLDETRAVSLVSLSEDIEFEYRVEVNGLTLNEIRIVNSGEGQVSVSNEFVLYSGVYHYPGSHCKVYLKIGKDLYTITMFFSSDTLTFDALIEKW